MYMYITGFTADVLIELGYVLDAAAYRLNYNDLRNIDPYIRWSSDHENPITPTEDCVVLRSSGNTGMMSVDCAHTGPSLCETEST